MQAERKELETNALAKQLNRAYEGMRQGPSRTTIVTLAVVIAAVLSIFLFRWFWLSSSAADSHRWVLLDEVMFPEQLSALLEETDLKGTTQERLARFRDARMLMAQGTRDLGSNSPSVRDKARENVKAAIERYEGLAEGAARSPLLHQQALWGAARGYEALGGVDNLDAASKLYQTLVREYEKTALGKDAKRQLERLNSPATKQDLRELARELDAK